VDWHVDYSFSPQKWGSMFLPALVCLSVCLSVNTITIKIVDGFVPNFMVRFLGEKGRPSSCFVMISRGMWKYRSKNSVNRRLFTFFTSNSRCGKCCQVLATKQLGSLAAIQKTYRICKFMKERDWSINTAATAVPLTTHPPLWWQSAIAFAGSCTVSFPSSLLMERC